MVVTLHKHTQRGPSDAPFYGKFPGKRILQEKDLLRFGLPPLEKVPLETRNPQPIGKFIDQHHSLGGDIEAPWNYLPPGRARGKRGVYRTKRTTAARTPLTVSNRISPAT
jgi:hypothetical protein